MFECEGLSASAAAPSRWRRFSRSLSAPEWRRLITLFAVIALLHVVGFGLLFAFIVPQHFDLGSGQGVFGIGVGVTAYTLGMRHAFDADHIGAIDNTTRKLMTDGQRPVSVGFFFSLGHSTVVFVLAMLFAFGIKGLGGDVTNDASTLHTVTGIIGPSVSGGFLLLIGVINLVILWGIVKVFLRMRDGEFDEARLEAHLNERGFMNRFLGRATRAVNASWQMYPLGVLFGLGFDTATEIALLATAGVAATSGLPFYAILALPILFAAGMSLLDTIDGAFMNVAYGWGFAQPVRKVFYNITITALSVAVALLIGSIEALQVLSNRFGLSGGVWDWLNALDFNLIGYFIVGLFVITWVLALSVWRFGRIEEKWTARLKASEVI